MLKTEEKLELHNVTHYYLNGKLHREDGPAVEYGDGSKHWYLNGKRHRENGPAMEFVTGRKDWFINGKRHREDGPAVERANGEKRWYLNGICYEQIKCNSEWLNFIKTILLV